MKYLIFSILFLLPSLVFATSGACSSHGGVNCNKGHQPNGRVYCNDGWTDSITFYDYTQKCKSDDFCWYLKAYQPENYEKLNVEYNVKDNLKKHEQAHQEYLNFKERYLDIDIKNISREEKLDYLLKQNEATSILNTSKMYQNLYFRSLDSVKHLCNIDGKIAYYEHLSEEIKKDIKCKTGYIKKDGACITHSQNCINVYGANVYGKANDSNESSCYCIDGYKWDVTRTHCIREVAIKPDKKETHQPDNALSLRLSGRILLQVESRGEAWYVNRANNKRYYMSDGNEAYSIMRNLGVGITNNDLSKIQGNKIFAKKHSGKIFLQVEDLGQAFYIDFNGFAHYLKNGDEAYSVMRSQGLGISNNDLQKIEVN